MGTLLKYIIYIALIVAAYFIIQGIWDNKITEDSTVKEVASQVGTGVDNAAQNAMQAVQNAKNSQK